jgi:hypothetical protein
VWLGEDIFAEDLLECAQDVALGEDAHEPPILDDGQRADARSRISACLTSRSVTIPFHWRLRVNYGSRRARRRVEQRSCAWSQESAGPVSCRAARSAGASQQWTDAGRQIPPQGPGGAGSGPTLVLSGSVERGTEVVMRRQAVRQGFELLLACTEEDGVR